MSLDGMPCVYIGAHRKGAPYLHVATGFNKWGMTGSMLAATMLAEQIETGIRAHWPVRCGRGGPCCIPPCSPISARRRCICLSRAGDIAPGLRPALERIGTELGLPMSRFAVRLPRPADGQSRKERGSPLNNGFEGFYFKHQADGMTSGAHSRPIPARSKVYPGR